MRKQSTNGQKMLCTMERVTNSDDYSGAPEPERPRRGRLSGEADFLGRVASWGGCPQGRLPPRRGRIPGDADSRAWAAPRRDRPLGVDGFLEWLPPRAVASPARPDPRRDRLPRVIVPSVTTACTKSVTLYAFLREMCRISRALHVFVCETRHFARIIGTPIPYQPRSAI